MKLAFDTGGTFTDLALLDDAGVVHPHKVLSTPDDPSRAVLQGIDELLRMRQSQGRDVAAIFGATTVVTNAVLERRGARTALITTDGFQDILRIRTEGRYDLYDLKLQFSEPLVSRTDCFGAVERVTVDGDVLVPLDEAGVKAIAAAIKARGIASVAVCLLHGYRYTRHEERIGALLREHLPGVSVSLSSAVCPEIREYDRASTTAANAYTRPLMSGHVAQLEDELARRGTGQLLWMTSSGGIVPGITASALPVRMIESGPAAGVVAAGEYARQSGDGDLLSFDMGGTTAKLCMLLDGHPRIAPELEVAHAARFRRGSGLPLKIQSVQMIEIGAGGGSIAHVGPLGLLAVGPSSAGASPGPACYGIGGTEPTVTDIDLILGYLHQDSFLGGSFRLDRAAAQAAVDRLAGELGLTPERCAQGVHDLVNETMARAATMHAMDGGVDPSRLSMMAFGGAGPVHAYGVARKIGVKRVVCPLGAGVNSALGLLAAPVAVDVAASAPVSLSQLDQAMLEQIRAGLIADAAPALAAALLPTAEITHSFSADMRHIGQGYEITIKLPGPEIPLERFKSEVRDAFRATYLQLYGREVEGTGIEVITWRLRASGAMGKGGAIHVEHRDKAALRGHRPVYFEEARGYVQTPVYDHYALDPGQEIAGPAIVEQKESTAVVGPSGRALLDARHNLVIALA
ncbi:MAG TPA: hydantoinase/oxoprolinase family protein [Acetobacteraceae bacterium]|nr:hydantoinase/oxoprolinase family protein [Acetobacteraceae bacterium]